MSSRAFADRESKSAVSSSRIRTTPPASPASLSHGQPQSAPVAFSFADIPVFSACENQEQGVESFRHPLQTKLVTGAADDPLEREAERVAERVMRMPGPGGAALTAAGEVLQRKCTACSEQDNEGNEEETYDKLSRKPAGDASASGGGEAPLVVHDVLGSSAEPLDPRTRAFFEPRFGTNLGSVRIHTHELAGRSAQAVNALAYTVKNHIVFGNGQYAPGTREGLCLLAHELAHTIQQTSGNRPPLAPTLNPGALGISSGPLRLSRATVRFGNVSAKVDYGDLINIPARDYVAAIQSRFQSYAGAALDPAAVAQITAFSPQQQQWVLFALDILSENVTRAPGLDRTQAFQRVVTRATSSTTRPLGTASQAFEREVLVSSGWTEEAVSGGLAAPSAASLAVIDPLLNPPPAPTAPAGGVFDPVTFKAELPGLTSALLSSATQNPANWPGTRAQPLADVQSVGDVIQEQARSFFAPYVETARDNRWLAGWQYRSNISSVTTDTAGSPRAISRDERLNLLENRATIAGQNDASGPSLFSRTNFDPRRPGDAAVFDAVIAALEADPAVQPLVDELARHTGQTNRLTHVVKISTEVSTALSECTTRWNTIRTLCHELMHALAHRDFFAASSSSPRFPNGITFDQVLVEGFAEVLGVELFRFLRTTAAGNASLLSKLTQGVTGTCTPPTTPVNIGYRAAGTNAQTILGQVGDDRFRAAFFHGRVSLIGL
jgi:hypothetical protein